MQRVLVVYIANVVLWSLATALCLRGWMLIADGAQAQRNGQGRRVYALCRPEHITHLVAIGQYEAATETAVGTCIAALREGTIHIEDCDYKDRVSPALLRAIPRTSPLGIGFAFPRHVGLKVLDASEWSVSVELDENGRVQCGSAICP